MLELTATQLGIIVAVSGAAGWLLRKNLWRAGIWLFPTSVRVEDDAPATANIKLPAALEPHARELARLGFTFIGTHLEQPRFAASVTSYDYGLASGQAFASLFLDEDEQARAELLTPLEGGGFVRTANYRRTALEDRGYFSGYLENIPLERVLHAHQRTVGSIGKPLDRWDTQARLSAARAWYQSPAAQRELRRQHQSGLVWTFGAAVSVGLMLVTLVG